MVEQVANIYEIAEVVLPERLVRDDLRKAADILTAHEARFLVDMYYTMQETRKRSANQVRALTSSGEPNDCVQHFTRESVKFEGDLRYALGRYAAAQRIGQWAQSITGIGPVISAGLMAHIDIEKAPTVGHIWRFAGLDPNSDWKGRVKAEAIVKEHLGKRKPTPEDVLAISQKMNGIGYEAALRHATTKNDGSPRDLTADSIASAFALRPWNAKLKTLCWKIGESFVKVSNHPDDIYGHIYAERKLQEQDRSLQGDYKDQADAKAAKVGKGTEAYKAYSIGQLPPAHLHARAERYATKLFLAHWHHVAYASHFGKPPPKPYVIEHMGHAHYIAPPNWPMS